MVTLTAQIPRTLPTMLRSSRRNYHTALVRCRPDRTLRRTRRDVLRALVGADGERFPHMPRRRLLP